MRKRSGPILAADTTTPQGGVALLAGDGTLTCIAFGSASPSRRLMPAVRDLLNSAGVTPAELSAVAMTEGPGSFTGIRVGLATLRALAAAAGAAAIGVSTLDAMIAADEHPGAHVAAWLDAGRGEIYAAFQAGGEDPGAGKMAPPGDILAELPAQPIRFVGPAAATLAETIAGRPGSHPGDVVQWDLPQLAPAVARLAVRRLEELNGSPAPPEARYLRPPEVLRARG